MPDQDLNNKPPYVMGKIVGQLIVVSIFSGALIWSFNLTIPQGIVLGWLFFLLNDGIRSSNNKGNKDS